MSNSVVKNLINNGLANLLLKLVRCIEQLLLIPFFLTAWGAAYYGEWLTLSIIPSILALSDLGFGSAVSNGYVLAYAAGDKQTAANLNKSGYFIISLSVIIGVLLTIGILIFGDNLGLLSKSIIPANDAIMAVTIIILSKLISFYLQLIEAYYRSARQAAKSMVYQSFYNILNIIVGLIVLICGGRVVAFAISQLMVSVFFTFFFYFNGRKLVSYDNCKGKIVRSDLKMIVSKGIGYLMTPVWQSIYFQGSTFAVRLVLGAETVAIFNTIRTVCRSVNQIFSIINASIFPDLQFEYGRGNMIIVHRIFRVAVLISIIIGCLGVLILCLLGLDIYSWWTRGMLIVSTKVWYIFMLGAFFNAIWWTSVVTYRMTNRPYHFAIMSTIMSIVSVLITYFLSTTYGLIGAAFGVTVFEFVMMIYVLPDSCNMLNMRVSDLFTHVNEDYSYIKQKISNKIRCKR